MKRTVLLTVFVLGLACIVSAQDAPARTANNRPLGTWEQSSDDGKITLTITVDRLRINSTGKDNKARWLLDADYSVTKDSILFAIVCSIEEKSPSVEPPDVPRTLSPEFAPRDCRLRVDDVFSFRYRIDDDVLTIKDTNARTASRNGNSILRGRFKKVAEAAGKQEAEKPRTKDETVAEKKSRVEWRLDYAKAVQEAREKNRPLILAVFAQNSYYCKLLEKDTLNHRSIASLLNQRCIPVKLIGDEHRKLAESLNVEVYPTLIFATPTGKINHKQQGFINADDLRKHLTNLFPVERKQPR